MTPHWGRHCSLSVLQATPLSRSQKLKGLFKLTRRPSRSLNLPLWVTFQTTEMQGHWQVCHVRQKGPRTLAKTGDQNLDCVSKKHPF